MSYTRAGGIDRPLVITKNGVSVVPHQNWRGMFALGTNPAGGRDVPDIDWPGFHTTPWHGATRVVENWFGSLSTEMRDATGQLYKRNRYYDPASGQFTQPDPIGLAGGLNSYGFASGDPVTYSDPYGLCAWGYGREAALGLCTETDARHAPQTREECERTPGGACKTYAPINEWNAVGNQIRRLPTRGKCGWIRTEMLRMWRRGPEAGHYLFWDGLDVLRRDSRGRPIRWRVGQYVHDPVHPYFEFERFVFFDSPVAIPHEGLHMYYHHHPEPGVSYEVLHDRMYQEQNVCRLR